jgi:hypothetical protein
MVNRSWVRDIRGVLRVQVILEYLTVWAKLENVTLGVQLDQVIWRWTRAFLDSFCVQTIL